MSFSSSHRVFVGAYLILIMTIIITLPQAYASPIKLEQAQQKLTTLEKNSGGRLGVFALNTANGEILQLNAHQRFPFCSTFKVIAIGALLHHNQQDRSFLHKKIFYSQKDLVSYSPITKQHINSGMTVAQLCAAALQYSDNSAINLLMKQMGGPKTVNAYAYRIGDPAFRLDRWEPALNSAIPGDLRDTTTPAAMAASLQKLTLGEELPSQQREQLITWMKNNTTGSQRIRAGVPAGAVVADKTGGGDYGTTNDIAVIWLHDKAPWILTVYFTQDQKNANANNLIIAEVARIVTSAFH